MKKIIIALAVLAVCGITNVNWDINPDSKSAVTVEFKPVDEALADAKELGGYVAELSDDVIGMIRSAQQDGTSEAEDAAAVTETVYTVRELWDDAATEIGTFADYASAEAACPPGFTVFTEDGTALFTR